MYGVKLNELAGRRTALHFKATRLQARAVDAAPMAFWSEFASVFEAQNQVHSLCASVTAVYLPFFVFGRVLTRLDSPLT
jgi:hypothetical protein